MKSNLSTVVSSTKVASMRSIMTVLPLLIALAGCSTQPVKPVVENTPQLRFNLREGAWLGPIVITGVAANDTNLRKDGRVMSSTLTFLVTVCDSKAIFWSGQKDGSFRAAAREENFSFHSNHGNHLISFGNFDRNTQTTPEWAETQAVLLVELESGVLRAQWSRAVSNLLLPETDHDRNFFWHGVGTLKQVSTECPKEMMRAAIKDDLSNSR